jgi:hypothetical protein
MTVDEQRIIEAVYDEMRDDFAAIHSGTRPLTAALVRLYLTCGDFFRILDSKGAGAHTCNLRDIKAAYQAVTALIEGSDHE